MAEHHGAEHHVFGQARSLRTRPSARPAACRRRPGSSCEVLSSVAVGFSTILSVDDSPTRAAPIGPLNGMPESASAAEAPIIAGMSESTSLFDDITVATICTSLKKPSGKQRPDRPVDQPGGQDFFFGRTAFALEEAAGDLAGGVRAFLIIDREREEVLTRLGAAVLPTTVTSTTVSSRLTSTAPLACRAISPVSSVSCWLPQVSVFLICFNGVLCLQMKKTAGTRSRHLSGCRLRRAARSATRGMQRRDASPAHRYLRSPSRSISCWYLSAFVRFR